MVTTSDIKTTDKTRLGASVIKQTDLCQIIASVFDDEYDKNSIDRRVNARKSRRTFDFDDENLNMLTECPVRIFGVLDTYVASDRQNWNQSDMRQDGALQDSMLPNEPSDVAKARLMDAVKSVEETLIIYSSRCYQ